MHFPTPGRPAFGSGLIDSPLSRARRWRGGRPVRAVLAFAFLILAAALPVRADLKSSLGLFFELGPQDSVTALVQKSPTALQVETVDITTTEPKTLQEEVGAKPLAKLMAEARAAGVPVTEWTPSSGAAAPGATSAIPSAADTAIVGQAKRSHSSQNKNRTWYMTLQVPLSIWVYGLAVPLALDVDNSRLQIALPLITAPLAFGGHLWFARSRTFEDAHVAGTRYLSLASVYASYALPFAVLGEDEGDGDGESDAFRVASYFSMAAYPLGIWGGYKLGDKYVDLPGRIETQAKFALGFGTLGFFTPFLYYEDVDAHSEAILRLGLGQSLVMGVTGHMVSSYYRAGENIPDGVTTGILTHSVLGAGLGLEVAALSDASSVRPWLGAALAGGTLGFVEGLWFFNNRFDSNERGLYNAIGAGLGMVMGGGILALVADEDASDHAQKITVTSLLLGGALLGYIATDRLTTDMVDRPAAGPTKWTDRLAFNPLPLPEPQVVDLGMEKEIRYRYRVPGLSYRF